MCSGMRVQMAIISLTVMIALSTTPHAKAFFSDVQHEMPATFKKKERISEEQLSLG